MLQSYTAKHRFGVEMAEIQSGYTCNKQYSKEGEITLCLRQHGKVKFLIETNNYKMMLFYADVQIMNYKANYSKMVNQ